VLLSAAISARNKAGSNAHREGPKKFAYASLRNSTLAGPGSKPAFVPRSISSVTARLPRSRAFTRSAAPASIKAAAGVGPAKRLPSLYRLADNCPRARVAAVPTVSLVVRSPGRAAYDADLAGCTAGRRGPTGRGPRRSFCCSVEAASVVAAGAAVLCRCVCCNAVVLACPRPVCRHL